MSNGLPNPPQTVFFRACRGVFQGGGCRAAAHVGAYEAAIASGVNFSEVAGTSAGAIIASLIGATASPEYLNEHCANLDFRQFLTKPDRVIKTGILGRLLSLVPYSLARASFLLSVLARGSHHSSSSIEDWIEQRLKELLPDVAGPVLFRDLVIPTWVVATDFMGGRPKVWSTYDTPDDRVAFAVRCSSSIPLFFEPVVSGNNLLVDGGMLSNLPAFVFSSNDSSSKLGGRVLAFRLIEQEAQGARPLLKLFPYAKRLLNTAIGGATELQVSVQSNVNIVSIDTGTVKATDFDISAEQVEQLLTSGRTATYDFIRNEGSHVRDDQPSDTTSFDEDSFYDQFTREALIPGKGVIVAGQSTLWFWRLFPSFLKWRAYGAKLDVIVGPPTGDDDGIRRELQRRSYLTGIGARISEVQSLPVSGFLLSRTDEHRESVFLLNPSQTDYAPYGSAYIGTVHRQVIEASRSLLESIMVGEADGTDVQITLAEVNEAQIVERLKIGVGQYNPDHVQIALETVQVSDAHLIVRYVRSYKFHQIRHLADLYAASGIPFFVPAVVQGNGLEVSRVTPPIVEIWGDRPITLEGNTRFLFAYKNGIHELRCIVVRGVNDAPLPGTPVPISHVLLSSRRMKPEERSEGFNYDNFRSIEGAARPL